MAKRETDEAERARLLAFRARMFESVRAAPARGRIVWVVPLQALVVAVLYWAKADPIHIWVHAAITALCAVLFALQVVQKGEERHRGGGAIVGILIYTASILNTGGLVSPLLVTGLPLLLAAATHPTLVERRSFVLFTVCSAFAVVMLLSHHHFTELPNPFAFEHGRPSNAYILVASLGIVLTATTVFVMGRTMAEVYERVTREIAHMRESAFRESEVQNRELEGIAARLAHEVRNPLAAIKALSLHVARNATDEKVRERLEIVSSEAERLQGIVDGFVSFSRGLHDLAIEPTRPFEVATNIVKLLELRTEEAGVSLAVSGDARVAFPADPQKLKQTLLNLIQNAVHASKRGGAVEVRIVFDPPQDVYVHVIDHGAGMTPEILARIQKPYFTTKRGGSGLGLAVARSIVEQHGGTLRIESTAGVGTTVTLHFNKNHTPLNLPKPVRSVDNGAEHA